MSTQRAPISSSGDPDIQSDDEGGDVPMWRPHPTTVFLYKTSNDASLLKNHILEVFLQKVSEKYDNLATEPESVIEKVRWKSSTVRESSVRSTRSQRSM